MILLDTVVLSELRKPQPSEAVVQWLSRQRDSELFLSVVSLGEIERSIEKSGYPIQISPGRGSAGSMTCSNFMAIKSCLLPPWLPGTGEYCRPAWGMTAPTC